MPTTMFSGSVIPTQNVIHIVGTISQSGIYVNQWDVGSMRAGDEIELRINTQIGAGTVSCIYLASYAHNQSSQVKASPPFLISNTGHISIVQRAGSTRTFFYEVLSV